MEKRKRWLLRCREESDEVGGMVVVADKERRGSNSLFYVQLVVMSASAFGRRSKQLFQPFSDPYTPY